MRVIFDTDDSAIWALMRVPMHHKLNEVWAWILRRLIAQGCEEVVWSSYYRAKLPGESGIHDTDPCRALDWYPVKWSLIKIRRFEDEVNNAWDYGKVNPKTGRSYKVLWWHDVGRGAHFHTQARNETLLM